MPWPIKSDKTTAFSEEEVCIVSKAAPCAIWAGTKILYSGLWASGDNITGASGYNFLSGDTDISPINNSGWGRIRVPELNQLHKLLVFPHDPQINARTDYTTLTLGTTSGLPSGHGGCSGKIALVKYMDVGAALSGVLGGTSYCFGSGIYTSGLVNIVAFGSQF
ncbi:MAG: hypothetical protein KKB31_04910 [Nanoarchaeota archaeon]|nr:hypothetical protein [Nanoarchaeota archaeon]